MNYDTAVKVTSHAIVAGLMPMTMAADPMNDVFVLVRVAVKS